MTEKVTNLLKERDFLVPQILFLNYKKLNLTSDELVMLIYIINTSLIFNPKKISDDLKLSLPEVLEIVSNLTSKDIIKTELVSINNVKEEQFDLTNLYKKLSFIVINDEVEEESTNIFDIFEKEFGRTLSPIEYELIKGWMDSDFSEEIIIMALKESVYNGVSNLRYIDKILFEWKKKGVKTKEDVENLRKNFNKTKEQPKEVFDYDWLNDND